MKLSLILPGAIVDVHFERLLMKKSLGEVLAIAAMCAKPEDEQPPTKRFSFAIAPTLRCAA